MNDDFAIAMDRVHNSTLRGMLRRIDVALNNREAFELAKNPKGSNIELKAAIKQMAGNETLARFFCVLGADPVYYLNRERKAGYRTNLKTVRKVRMLSEYMAGYSGAINGVCKALFAASILSAKSGYKWLSNNDAELILLQLRTGVENEELQDSLREFNALSITDAKEARNQACQFRTAFENLGVFAHDRADSSDLNSNGVSANLANPLIIALAKRWGI